MRKEYPEIISCLFVDRNGNLWIGSATGLTKYRRGNEIPFKTYTTKDGLLSNKVYTIHEDAGHDLWFGTRKGIVIVAPEKMYKKRIPPGS